MSRYPVRLVSVLPSPLPPWQGTAPDVTVDPDLEVRGRRTLVERRVHLDTSRGPWSPSVLLHTWDGTDDRPSGAPPVPHPLRNTAEGTPKEVKKTSRDQEKEEKFVK